MSWSTVWHSNCVRTNQTVCKIRKYDESADSFMEYIILWHNDCLSNMPCVRNGPFKYKKICKTRNLVKIACRKWILYSNHNTFLFDVETFDIRYWYWTGFTKWFSLTPICDLWRTDEDQIDIFPVMMTRWHGADMWRGVPSWQSSPLHRSYGVNTFQKWRYSCELLSVRSPGSGVVVGVVLTRGI